MISELLGTRICCSSWFMMTYSAPAVPGPGRGRASVPALEPSRQRKSGRDLSAHPARSSHYLTPGCVSWVTSITFSGDRG